MFNLFVFIYFLTIFRVLKFLIKAVLHFFYFNSVYDDKTSIFHLKKFKFLINLSYFYCISFTLTNTYFKKLFFEINSWICVDIWVVIWLHSFDYTLMLLIQGSIKSIKIELVLKDNKLNVSLSYDLIFNDYMNLNYFSIDNGIENLIFYF